MVGFVAAALPLLSAMAASANLTQLLDPAALGFDPSLAAEYTTNVTVGIYLNHLYAIDDKTHLFEADLFTVFRWQDGRNYSSLFAPGSWAQRSVCGKSARVEMSSGDLNLICA